MSGVRHSPSWLDVFAGTDTPQDRVPAWVARPPDPYRSDREARRYLHQDLEELSDNEVWRELERAKHSVVVVEKPDRWFLERLKRCASEIRRRRGGRR